MIIKGLNRLKAPEEYWDLSPFQLKEISNGCGPKGWGWIVPDCFRFMGVHFGPSCDIHDFMYSFGYDKKECDLLFYENNMECAKSAYFPFLPLAEHWAFIYYLFVKNCGRAAYENSKKRRNLCNF